MMSVAEFLLTREPWIPVLTPQGTDIVGLVEVFERCESLMIAPRGPLEERALHRLLLAIAYASLGAPTAQQYPRGVNGTQVAQWLRDHERSFDLLSAEAPFGQDRSLEDTPKSAQAVPVANLDTTVARSRPLLTDHRTATDVGPVPLAEAALLVLVYNLFDAPGIHEGVKTPALTNYSLKGNEGSTLAFQLKGTLATVLSWSMIPVPQVGQGQWTYTGEGNAEVDPQTELEALTLIYRRVLLHHDGSHATTVQVHQGQRRAKPATPGPADTHPGQHHLVLSASNPNTAAATGTIGEPATSGRGNPLALIQRWEAASPTSLSGWVRQALADNPTLTPPQVVAIGQRLENTALKVSVLEAPIPRVHGTYSTRAEELLTARRERRLPSSTDAQLVDLLDAQTPAEITTALDALAAPPPSLEWPTHAQPLNTAATRPASTNDDVGLPGLSADTLRELATVVEVEDRKDSVPDTATTLRRIRGGLHAHPDAAEHLARLTTHRIPTAQDLAALTTEELPPALRLWAGLLATSIHTWRHGWDGHKPLPIALRQAGARGNFTRAHDVLSAATNATDLALLREPLTQAVALLATTATPLSWWSLADDLENWSHRLRTTWRDAFTNPATTKAN